MKVKDAGPESAVPAMAAAGAAALVGQTLIVRELMVSFYGTELALAAALTCWLAFIPAGAVCGSLSMKGRPARARTTALALIAVGVTLVAGVLVARLVRPMVGAELGEYLSLPHMLVGAALAAAPIGLSVGFLFPVTVSWEEVLTGGRGGGVGRTYVAEAVGAAVAGGILSFYVVGRLDPVAIAFAGAAVLLLACSAWASGVRGSVSVAACIAGAVLLCGAAAAGRPSAFFLAFGAAALLGTAWAWRTGRPGAMLWSALLVTCGVYLLVGPRLSVWTAIARWRTVCSFRLAASADTRYQHAQVGERQGNHVLVQNGVVAAQYPEPHAAKVHAGLLLTQHPAPRDLLVIGGGLTGLCQALIEGSVKAIDYVEPDPGLISLVITDLPIDLQRPLGDGRLAAYACDGRYFVRQCRRDPASVAMHLSTLVGGDRAEPRPVGSYDLVALNLGDPTSGSAERFYSVEFFRQVRAVLRPGGVLAVCGITGDENYVADGPLLDYTACVYASLRRVFEHVVVRPGGEFCYFASSLEGVVSADAGQLAERFGRLGLQPAGLRHMFGLELFPAERVAWVRTVLDAAEETALVSTDARPVVSTLFLRVQSRYAGKVGDVNRRTVLDSLVRLRHLPSGALCMGLAAPFLLLLVLRLGAKRRYVQWACGLSVLTTGVFGMSTELVLVYGYQTAFGYVYRDIGALAGLFMLGLAVGGWAMHRFAVRRAVRPLLALEASQAVFALALPLAVRACSLSPWGFMLLSLVAGFLTGSLFPLAARVSAGQGRRAAPVAGVLDAADHLGGLVGAALSGMLLVPVLGLAATSTLLALLKCVSLVGFLVGMPQAAGRVGPGGPA